MDIGTAKVSRSPARGACATTCSTSSTSREELSVAAYQGWARAVLRDLAARGVPAVVVGGSGLYVRALLDDLRFPGSDPEIRARWERQLGRPRTPGPARRPARARSRRRGPHPAHERAAHRASPRGGRADRQGVRRSASRGRPTTRAHMSASAWTSPRDRARRADRAARRRMFEQGLVDEVRHLIGSGLRDGRTASRALGYPQVMDLLDGRVDRATAVEGIVLATQRLARRQQRWFHRDPRTTWLDASAEPSSTASRIVGLLAASPRKAWAMSPAAVPFVKGHGTGNDFVLLPEIDAASVTPSHRQGAVRSPPRCRRRRGPGRGADRGASRGGRRRLAWRPGSWTTATPTAACPRCAATARASSSPTCWRPGSPAPGTFSIATRGGARGVVVDDRASIGIDMGHARFLDRRRRPCRCGRVERAGRRGSRPSGSCCPTRTPSPGWTTSRRPATLRAAPVVTPDEAFPDGVNVEFVASPGRRTTSRCACSSVASARPMSCGTGACAAAVATIRRGGGAPAGQQVRVDVPGGTLVVTWRARRLGRPPGADAGRGPGHPGARMVGGAMSETPDLLDRQALRRVPGLSTELEDVTEVEYRQVRLERVVLVGVWTAGTLGDAERSLAELARLAETAGSEVCDGLIQRRDRPDTATYIGSGKVTELREVVRSVGADTVICDGELTPGQLRRLEELGEGQGRRPHVADPRHLRPARTQPGGARRRCRWPRCSTCCRGCAAGASPCRDRPAVASPAVRASARRGPGETKIETDRRRVRESISRLRREIAAMATARRTMRGARQAQLTSRPWSWPVTRTPGKSSLLNRMTGAGVLVEDALFATLDPTVRRAETPSGRLFTLADTVGFVRHLPHQLVEAFRSTLEEVSDADLILHVVDGSDEFPEEQIAAVREVLAEIGASEVPELRGDQQVRRRRSAGRRSPARPGTALSASSRRPRARASRSCWPPSRRTCPTRPSASSCSSRSTGATSSARVHEEGRDVEVRVHPRGRPGACRGGGAARRRAGPGRGRGRGRSPWARAGSE